MSSPDGIQLAVAPVFLLTAVAGMIGVVANRLARIIDRARVVEGRLRDNAPGCDPAAAWKELANRAPAACWPTAALACSRCGAILIGATIVVLFPGETVDLPMLRASIVSFLAALVSFTPALGCFFAETLIATRLLNFGKSNTPPAKPR